MRKFLLVVAVGALALLMAAPAMAVDFKFGAEYRVRFYDYNNIGFDSDNTLGRGNPRGIQVRVRPRFDASDDNGNITATVRFEYGDTEFGARGGANGSSFGTNQLPTGAVGGTNLTIAPSNSRVGNGAGGSIGADGVALETKWAYMDFAMPFGVPLRVRAGIQPWYLPKGLVIDDDIAGVRAYGQIAPVSYEAFWYRASRGTATSLPPANAAGTPGFDNTRDNALDYYGGKIDFAIAPFFNPGLYYVYGDNRTQCTPDALACPPAKRVRPQHFFGFTTTGKVGIVDYDFDFVYGSTKGGITGNFGTGGVNAAPLSGTSVGVAGNLNDPITVKGWVIDAGVHIPIGPVKLNLLGTYATGDKQNGGDSDAFPLGPGPSWSGAGGQYELIGEGGAFDVVSMTQHSPTGLWMIGATVEYVPVKPLWLKLAYGYAGFSKKEGNCATAFTDTGVKIPGSTCFGPVYFGKPGETLQGRSTLGQEFHLRADYTVWTGFKLQGMVGWLIPSKGDTASKYILQMYYNF